MQQVEEETKFRSSSPGEDYRAAVADSTSGRNSDPVPIAYRQISSTSGPSTTTGNPPAPAPAPSGYVNGGSDPMDFRPRQPEPELGGGGPVGVGLEVEFDSKFTDAYANLDDVRDHNYHLARSPERMASTTPVYMGGLPNTATKEKIEKKKACRSCVLQSLLVVLFVAVLVGLGLAAFNLANTLSIGSITGVPPADTGELALSIQQLRVELEEVRQSMLNYRGMHTAHFDRVDSELIRLSAAVDSLFPTPQPISSSTPSPPSGTAATPPPMNTTTPLTPQPPGSQSAAVLVYENCTVHFKKSCSVSSFELLGRDPDKIKFSSCTTTPVELVPEDENGHLTDVFCAVSMYQEMPVSSTLSYVGETWACICHALEIPNLLQERILSFNCEMYERRCPSEIELPRPPNY